MKCIWYMLIFFILNMTWKKNCDEKRFGCDRMGVKEGRVYFLFLNYKDYKIFFLKS